MLNIISYSIGTLFSFVLVATFLFWAMQDMTQKKHAVLRSFPVFVDSLSPNRHLDITNVDELIASSKLATPAKAAWALCIGAGFVNTARGLMFSLGCIRAMWCHTN